MIEVLEDAVPEVSLTTQWRSLTLAAAFWDLFRDDLSALQVSRTDSEEDLHKAKKRRALADEELKLMEAIQKTQQITQSDQPSGQSTETSTAASMELSRDDLSALRQRQEKIIVGGFAPEQSQQALSILLSHFS